jgi:hypothetical protein
LKQKLHRRGSSTGVAARPAQHLNRYSSSTAAGVQHRSRSTNECEVPSACGIVARRTRATWFTLHRSARRANVQCSPRCVAGAVKGPRRPSHSMLVRPTIVFGLTPEPSLVSPTSSTIQRPCPTAWSRRDQAQTPWPSDRSHIRTPAGNGDISRRTTESDSEFFSKRWTTRDFFHRRGTESRGPEGMLP